MGFDRGLQLGKLRLALLRRRGFDIPLVLALQVENSAIMPW